MLSITTETKEIKLYINLAINIKSKDYFRIKWLMVSSSSISSSQKQFSPRVKRDHQGFNSKVVLSLYNKYFMAMVQISPLIFTADLKGLTVPQG